MTSTTLDALGYVPNTVNLFAAKFLNFLRNPSTLGGYDCFSCCLCPVDRASELYRAKGVRFISLPDAMSDPAYQDNPDVGEATGGTFLELMMKKKKIKFPSNSKPYRELEAMCR
jgi:hypothetical protein